jgi:hypothetical protein
MRFPRPRGTLPPRPVPPAPTEASARPGGREAPAGGGAGAGQRLWPTAGVRAACRCGRGDGPCHGGEAGGSDSDLPPPVRAGSGNACVSPARAGQCPVDRQVQAHRRPAPDPAGGKRPPRAGRALAGGFGPPAGLGSAQRCGRGDGPRHGGEAGGSDADLPAPLRAGPRNARRFPRPRGTVHRRPAGPGIAEASARPGGREAPAGDGAGAGRGLWAPGGPGIGGTRWQGRWPLPLKRGWCFGPCSSAPSPGGKRKRTAFPPPVRDSAP